MASKRFKPVCQYCGKVGGGTPNETPSILGKCPSSPTGKHAPRWEPL